VAIGSARIKPFMGNTFRTFFPSLAIDCRCNLTMYKLLCEVDGKYREHSFPAVFNQSVAGGVARIHAGLPAGGLESFESLVAQIEACLA
jgi:hypothetical protein